MRGRSYLLLTDLPSESVLIFVTQLGGFTAGYTQRAKVKSHLLGLANIVRLSPGLFSYVWPPSPAQSCGCWL